MLIWYQLSVFIEGELWRKQQLAFLLICDQLIWSISQSIMTEPDWKLVSSNHIFSHQIYNWGWDVIPVVFLQNTTTTTNSEWWDLSSSLKWKHLSAGEYIATHVIIVATASNAHSLVISAVSQSIPLSRIIMSLTWQQMHDADATGDILGILFSTLLAQAGLDRNLESNVIHTWNLCELCRATWSHRTTQNDQDFTTSCGPTPDHRPTESSCGSDSSGTS